MKVLVDTSCWIHAFRYAGSFEASVLEGLLDENQVVTSSLIIAELIRGAQRKKEKSFIRRDFLNIPLATGIDFLGIKIGDLGFKLRKKGITIPTIDLALCALAIENNLYLYSLDHHFKMIAKQSPLKLFKPLKH